MPRDRRASTIPLGARAALAIGLISAFGAACRKVEVPIVAEPDVALRRSVPHPIVLLHGLGGDGTAWSGLAEHLRANKLGDGGVVRLGTQGEPEFVGAVVPPERVDFFRLQISDPYQSLAAWTSELDRLLTAIRQRTGASTVVLVGHSAGGLVGRRYLVDKYADHHVSKLVTVATPHRGSDLALVPPFLAMIRESVSDGKAEENVLERFVGMSHQEIEKRVGFPLDSPILRDLLPESSNPDLAALNRRNHPLGVEYECLRALGDRTFEHWGAIEKVLSGEISPSQIDLKRFIMDLVAFLNKGTASQGDGAVTVESQDLRHVDFFWRHPHLISECRGVFARHSEIKEQYPDLLRAIASPVRFQRARRVGDEEHLKLELDYFDYFAGRVGIEVHARPSGTPLPVDPPAIYKRQGREIGRVAVKPFDARKVQAVDFVITSLDGRRYGQRLILDSSPPELLPPAAPDPLTLDLLRIEETSKGHGLLNLFPWDDDSPPDLQVVLAIDGDSAYISPVYSDVVGSLDIRQRVQLDIDPTDAVIALRLFDADPESGASEPMGQFEWNPGMLPRGEFAVRTTGGLVRLNATGPTHSPIQWAKRPLVFPRH